MEVILVFAVWAIAVYRQESKKYDASLKARAIEDENLAIAADLEVEKFFGKLNQDISIALSRYR